MKASGSISKGNGVSKLIAALNLTTVSSVKGFNLSQVLELDFRLSRIASARSNTKEGLGIRLGFSGGASPGVGGNWCANVLSTGLCLKSGVFGSVSWEARGVGIKDFRSVFFGGIGIGGELEGPEAVLWLEGLLFWLEPEAIVFDVK